MANHKIRWHGKLLTSICTATDAIMEEAGNDAADLDTIYSLAETAQSMGQAMEEGLIAKGTRIKELELLLEDCHMQLEEYQMSR